MISFFNLVILRDLDRLDLLYTLLIKALVLRARLEVNEDHACGALGLGGLAEDGAGADVHVGDGLLLAHDGDVCDDVDGGDVGREDAQALLALGGLLLADGLDDLLHAAADLLLLGRLRHELVHALCELVVGEWAGDGDEKRGLVGDVDGAGLLGGGGSLLSGSLLVRSLCGLGGVAHSRVILYRCVCLCVLYKIFGEFIYIIVLFLFFCFNYCPYLELFFFPFCVAIVSFFP